MPFLCIRDIINEKYCGVPLFNLDTFPYAAPHQLVIIIYLRAIICDVLCISVVYWALAPMLIYNKQRALLDNVRH